MTIDPEISARWQKACNDLQRASEAFDLNRYSGTRLTYLRLYRYAVRRCEAAGRRM